MGVETVATCDDERQKSRRTNEYQQIAVYSHDCRIIALCTDEDENSQRVYR